MGESVDFFFGDAARVAPSTNLHDRLADLLLTAMAFAADDPGGRPPRRRLGTRCRTPLSAMRQAVRALPVVYLCMLLGFCTCQASLVQGATARDCVQRQFIQN